jgi:hypothetical protein
LPCKAAKKPLNGGFGAKLQKIIHFFSFFFGYSEKKRNFAVEIYYNQIISTTTKRKGIL